MKLQIILAGISSVIGILCFLPYIRDIFTGTTRPHRYTWFIWAVLQAVAAAAMWSAGAGWAIASSVIGVVLCGFIFFLSFRHGAEHITGFDKICLLGALIALAAYALLRDPLLSIMAATLTDVIGFLPTLRKAYREPLTETASTHLMSGASSAFAIAALAHVTVTTCLYLFAVMIMDASCGLIVLVRKRMLVGAR